MTTCGCIHYPLVTTRTSPSTGRLLTLCRVDAKLHDEGHAFTVYTTEENQ